MKDRLDARIDENKDSGNDFEILHGVLKGYHGKETAVVIPDGVREIGYGAFRGNTVLRQVTMPAGVTKISSMAFVGCENLRQVTIPPGVSEIGYSAFERCTSLTAMQLPAGLVLLDRMAFMGCTALADIGFPSSLRTVGRDALTGTAWLTKQPDGVVYAGQLALFAKGAVTQAQIRAGTVKICVDAFRNCETLAAVTLPDSLLEIGDRAFQNCRRLKQITIPPQVAVIGYRAFDECRKLQVLLRCGDPVMGKGCFADDAAVRITRMDPAKLPDAVRQSAILTFADDVCGGVSLEAAFSERFLRYLQSRRKLLYPLALEHWNLLQVMLQARMIPLEDVDPILDSVLAGAQAAEAAAALLQYKQKLSAASEADRPGALDGWDDLELDWDLPVAETSAVDLERAWGVKKLSDRTWTLLLYRGQDLDVTVPSRIGEKVITAIAPAACSPERYGIKRETADHRRRIRSVAVQEGITKIGNHAFAGCENLRQVTLPESLIEIGYEAFRDCKKLTALAIPQSVEKIGRGAFAGCSGLTKVELPAGVEVADDAFAACPVTAGNQSCGNDCADMALGLDRSVP